MPAASLHAPPSLPRQPPSHAETLALASALLSLDARLARAASGSQARSSERGESAAPAPAPASRQLWAPARSGAGTAAAYTRARRAEAAAAARLVNLRTSLASTFARAEAVREALDEDTACADARFPDALWCAQLPSATLDAVADMLASELAPGTRASDDPETYHRACAHATAKAAVAVSTAASRMRACAARLRAHAAAADRDIPSGTLGLTDGAAAQAARLQASAAADRARTGVARLTAAHERAFAAACERCMHSAGRARDVTGRAWRASTQRAAHTVRHDVISGFGDLSLKGWLFDDGGGGGTSGGTSDSEASSSRSDASDTAADDAGTSAPLTYA